MGAQGVAWKMIVSHRHRFIFIKTRRTAGSSIEAAIYPHLGPDDIITGSERDGTPRRNCPDKLTGHIPWRRIVGLVGEDTFWAYRRFCVERNPFDKSVSDWIYHRDVLGKDRSLERHILESGPTDWERYTECGYPVAAVLLFDSLPSTFRLLCSCVGLPRIDLNAFRLKAGPGPLQSYSRHHTPETRTAVREVFAREIEYFGYGDQCLNTNGRFRQPSPGSATTMSCDTGSQEIN